MSELGDLLRSLRGKRSLRDIKEASGLSHNYLSIIEKGKDPRSGAPVNPTPETLKKLSEVYQYPYELLMIKAGYIDEEEKKSDYPLPESEFDKIVLQTEHEFNIDLRNDPDVREAFRELVRRLAIMKQK